ncbi:MAG: 5'/3'-nucleotidase SurE [Anaerolineales bacterium]|nr:5'/3'-nucleotidase SurE [Anaerolineales bacterium]
MDKRQILLTNDDGILSPGLWAAADALSDLGHVTVVAPRDQSSGMGRSLPSTSDGLIQPEVLTVRGQEWTIYAVGGSPAQAVLHGVFEILQRKPDLVVSGINYGENVAANITISGTVGAAMEAAGMGIPALAMSLETGAEHHLSYSREVDFSAAAHFAAHFARLLLEKRLLPGIDLIKVDVPSDATAQTPWQITRLSRQSYFVPAPPKRTSWDEPETIGYREQANLDCEPDSDVYVLRVLRQVAVTPLTLDMTARVDLQGFEEQLRSD